MKKYNTPEMKVSMFDVESVLTVSGDWATMDAFTTENQVKAQIIDWSEVAGQITVSF